jgi:hypothetical protein
MLHRRKLLMGLIGLLIPAPGFRAVAQSKCRRREGSVVTRHRPGDNRRAGANVLLRGEGSDALKMETTADAAGVPATAGSAGPLSSSSNRSDRRLFFTKSQPAPGGDPQCRGAREVKK